MYEKYISKVLFGKSRGHNYWLKEIDATAYKKDILDKLGKKFGVSENLKGENQKRICG